jgi:predicted Zn finger-like uncharacterized protein
MPNMEIIQCERCQTRFRVARDLIKDTGTAVRCSNCQNVFTVFRTMPEDEYGPEELERRLERLLDDDPDEAPGPEAPKAPPRLLARQPKPAHVNPISLITADGDNFIVTYEPETIPAVPPPGPSTPPPPPPPPGPRTPPPPPGTPPPSPPVPRPPADSAPDLGLGDDPLSPIAIAAPGGPDPAEAPGGEPPEPPPPPLLRAKGGRTLSRRQKILVLILSIVLAILGVSSLISTLGSAPEPAPPSPPAAPAAAGEAAPPEPAQTESAPSAPDVLGLIFLKEQNTHHYVTHPEAGQLLVIVGRVRNGYERPISHVRVKGSLKSSDDRILAERQVFAGNYMTEDILKSLSMREILARLSLRGGENGSNLDIQPGQDVPFMLVFDKLPPDVAEYMVEPLGYTPADEVAR